MNAWSFSESEYKKRSFDEKKNKETDRMMRNEACQCGVDGTKFNLCKNSGSKEPGQDEEKEGWCSSHQQGQHMDQMSGSLRWWGRLRRLEKFHENGCRSMPKNVEQRSG